MSSDKNNFNFRDKCFLFLNLKIDSALFHRLPIELAPGIFLALTPQHALGQAAGRWSNERENIALAGWVYPGYGLGMGICNVCIRIDSSVPEELRNRYFWFMVEALYLTKPLFMHIAGSFIYGNEEEGYLGKTPVRILHKSNICLNIFFSHAEGNNLLLYNEDDFRQARIYFSHFVKIFNSKKIMARPYFVLKAFFETTLWERFIYASSSFSKLFPLIDSLTGNPTHKHDNKVSKRLSLFLKEIPSIFLDNPLSEDGIRLRILSIWHQHRGPDLHGYIKEPDVDVAKNSNQAPIDKPELKDLFDLMELSRLAIIKMLSLEDSLFEEYCQIPVPLRKYNSKEEKKSANKEREEASIRFFEGKTYESPEWMSAYSDFKGLAESRPSERLTTTASVKKMTGDQNQRR